MLVLFFVRDAVFLGGAFYTRDVSMQWFGQVESFVRAVAAGSWPVWDLYVSFGQPMLANANNQLLYPPTWLNLLVRPWTYYTWFLAGHLLVAGAGTYALARRLGTSSAGALAAAAIWTASGPLLSLGNLWNHLAATAWVPWILLAGDVALHSGRPAHALGWGALVALQTAAGSPDVTLLTVLVLAGQLGSRLLHPPPGPRRRARTVALAAVAGGYALALAAGQILPSLDLASRSDRWGLALEERTYWSLHPLSLLQVVVPLAWNDLPLKAEYRQVLFESREPLLLSVYLGLPVCALVLAALAGPRRPLRLTLAVTAVLALLFALGRHSPFYHAALAVLPPLGILRFPSKAMIFVGFACSLLAGMGFDALRERPASAGRSWTAMGAALAVAGCASIAGLALGGRWAAIFLVAPPPGTTAAAMVSPLEGGLAFTAVVSVVLLASLWIGRRYTQGGTFVATATTCIAVASLVYVHRGLNATVPREFYTFRPEVLTVVQQEDHRRLYVYDYLAALGRSQRLLGRESPYVPVATYRLVPHAWAGALANRMYLLPPIGAAFQVNDSYSRDNLGIQPTEVAELMAILAYAEGTPLHLRLLRLAAVSQVVALHDRGLESLVLQTSLTGPFQEPMRVFAVPDPLPRTYVVGGVRVDPGPDTLLDPSFDPAREVILAGGAPRPATPAFAGQSRIVELRPDRVRLQARLNAPGYVVLVDTYDPGWRASVDGQPTPLLRANHAFRAVALSEGVHEVEMTYRPPRLLAGLWISAVAAAGGLAFALARAFPRSAATR